MQIVSIPQRNAINKFHNTNRPCLLGRGNSDMVTERPVPNEFMSKV